MTRATIAGVALAAIAAACAAPSPLPRPTWADARSPQGESDDGSAPGAALAAAPPRRSTGNAEAAQRRAGTQPFLVRQPQNLRVGRTASQFRFEVNSDEAGGYVSAAHGVFDDLLVHAQVGTGQQFETVSLAADPGTLFDLGVQYALSDDPDLQVAARFDLVLSDEPSFESRPDPNESSQASFQPSLLVGGPLGDDLDFYGQLGVRVGDGVEPAYSAGAGIVAPLGRVNLFVETSFVAQQREPGKDVLEAYLTPGLQFLLRDKVDVSIAPSIGLSSTSYDWRVLFTMGVHF